MCTGSACELCRRGVRRGASRGDEFIDVQCFAPGGFPDDSRFTLMWTVNSTLVPA